MVRLFKGQKEIVSVEGWFELAPPKKGAIHWVDGRSAKELAKAWFSVERWPTVPCEMQALLNSRVETKGIAFQHGEPERVTCFDNCGEGRHADMVLWGCGPRGKVLASIEAKADEHFGEELVGIYCDRKQRENPKSRVPERIELLLKGVLGGATDKGEARDLRYQLLTAVAGAMVDAQRFDAEIVMILVHEFIGATNPDKIRTNEEDLNRFVNLLSHGKTDSISPEQPMAGPFKIPGNEHFRGTDCLFIGKCSRHVKGTD